jgi:hypothetical protein
LAIFEDKSGDQRLKDPRLSRLPLPVPVSENVQNVEGSGAGNNALFEQMSNLLTILNKPKPQPTSSSNSNNATGPSSAQAAQQLAQLLIDQTHDGGNSNK